MSRCVGTPGRRRGARSARLRTRLGTLGMLVAIAALFAGCTPADEVGSAGHRVGTWVQSTQMGQSVGSVLDDAARVTWAVSTHQDIGVIHTVCAVLLDDTEAANDNLPSPDQELTNLLSNAYGVEGSAANNCYDAGTGNAALQAKSARERAAARVGLRRALARVAALTGHSVSTTTTTQPDTGGLFG
jgi:hypothetical protein